MNKLLDFLFSSAASVWFFFAGKPKQLSPAPEYRHTWEDEPDPILDKSSIALLGELVRIKRELKGEIPPDERTQLIISHILNKVVPQMFHANFINGANELYISHIDVMLPGEHNWVNKDHFRKAIPHVHAKLKEISVSARTSSDMVIVSTGDLIKASEANDFVTDTVELPTMNTVGIYR